MDQRREEIIRFFAKQPRGVSAALVKASNGHAPGALRRSLNGAIIRRNQRAAGQILVVGAVVVGMLCGAGFAIALRSAASLFHRSARA